jgi:hypothetical protein
LFSYGFTTLYYSSLLAIVTNSYLVNRPSTLLRRSLQCEWAGCHR